MLKPRISPRRIFVVIALVLVGFGAPACGGGGGDDGNPTGSMALINFDQAGVQNSALNQVLGFLFSEPVDPQSLTPASLQVREGPDFGATVEGTFRISGSAVYFEPVLPGLCDLSDSGFKPDTHYRVTLVGSPETFALRRDDGHSGTATGDSLKGTLNFEFHTRAGDDPLLFTDQIAATPPVVTSTAPTDGTAAVQVLQGNQVVIDVSENLRPCTVSASTVLIDEYQRGDPAVFTVDPVSGRQTGFTPTADADPGDEFSWGTAIPPETTVSPPQRIRATIGLVQHFLGTRITVTPEFGQFPDNALCVVQLTFGIQDFGGNALVPHVFAFTTENLPLQNGVYDVRFEGETPILTDQSTADVDTIRSPLVAQGWLLFAGDADNGGNLLQPTLPENNPPACSLPRQINDGAKDDFDANLTDVTLDTGASVNVCPNTTDGSTAVVWEFRTFRIRAGRTVRVTGVNPAIILVQGDVVIEAGGRLQLRDGLATASTNGGTGATTGAATPGGVGYAGGGNGGTADAIGAASNEGQSGRSGFGSPAGQGALGGQGAGRGGSNAAITTFTQSGTGYGGGGGGHSQVGMDGASAMSGNGLVTYKSANVPAAGSTYPAMSDRMLLPSAGSGGGAGGYGDQTQSTGRDGAGGGGGGGGGFVDLTSSGNISIFGTIDCTGGRGGNGAAGFLYLGGGGGGGGSGGGIRLLTPNSINVAGGTLTTAGGQAGGASGNSGVPANAGGLGGKGRIVLEDGDSLIGGIGSATLVPAEGDPDNGFYRGVFDASRFQGGGLEPQVVTDVFLVGPNNPAFLVPVQSDFSASIPSGSDRGLNGTSCLIEARGFEILPDGEVDLALGASPWKTVGYFKHSGVASLPTWTANANPVDVTLPAGNTGPGITALDTLEFLQLRITFFLPASIGPFDPGPILDHWTIRFTFDQ
jgi:hypothetical protein